MTRFHCCLLFTVLFSLAVEPQNQPPSIAAQPQKQDQRPASGESKMRVDGRVVGQTYCDADSRFFPVLLEISLRFTNLSNGAVILSRKIPGPVAVRVAKDLGALRIGNFEYNPTFDWTQAELPKAPSLGNAPDSELFAILSSGESFETHISAHVIGTKTRREGLVGKGKHVLQLGVETWPYQWPWYTPIDAHKLADQWNKYGQLVTGIVYTEPLPFTIPEKVKVEPCE